MAAPDADPTMAALLLLGDGRFPAGGHAHSAGLEAAVVEGRVRDLPSLEAFTRGRLRTTGLVDAALAAATSARIATVPAGEEALAVVQRLDLEAEVRIAPPPLRAASRRLGRQLVRVASRCWPSALLVGVVDRCPEGAHLAVATGTVAVAAGIAPIGAARLVLHHALATPTQAAVKLLGLDPFEVVALAARLAPLAEEVAQQALACSAGALEDLPAFGGPVVDLAALDHPRADVRMFAT